MNPEEYAAQQALITAAAVAYVQQAASFIVTPALTLMDWFRFLELIFPEVQRRRSEAAALARVFYDSQRAKHHPELPRHDRFLEGTSFPQFVNSMEPIRHKMSQADSPSDATTMLALHVAREVENAGRKQILHAVQEDQAPMPVKGWARVATGRETCAWCLMLISRGPVYLRSETAGLDLLDSEVEDYWKKAEGDLDKFYEFTSEYMEEWHPGCDCKVVPVYKYEDWPGHDQWKAAEKLWIEASREATRLIESGEARSDNHNREALNALRRRLERGERVMSEFAALAA